MIWISRIDIWQNKADGLYNIIINDLNFENWYLTNKADGLYK